MLIKKINFTVNGIAQSSWENSITYTELVTLAGIKMHPDWHDTDGLRELTLGEGMAIVITKT